MSTIILGFSGHKYIRDVDKVTCGEICLDDADCVAVEFRNFTSTICSFFKGDVDGKVVNRKGSQIIVFLSQLATNKKVLSLERQAFEGMHIKPPDMIVDVVGGNVWMNWSATLIRGVPQGA